MSTPNSTLGNALDSINFFGAACLTIQKYPVKTDCVSVSVAQLEYYKDSNELWSLLGASLPNRPLQSFEIVDLLNRTGACYQWRQYMSQPGGKSAIALLYDDWVSDPAPSTYTIGLVFYVRSDGSAHCVDFVNQHNEKRMGFVDFQYEFLGNDLDTGMDCWDDISEAETIVIAWDSARNTFNNWSCDSNLERRARAEALESNGFCPIGTIEQNPFVRGTGTGSVSNIWTKGSNPLPMHIGWIERHDKKSGGRWDSGMFVGTNMPEGHWGWRKWCEIRGEHPAGLTERIESQRARNQELIR